MIKTKIGILTGCFVMMSYLAISPAIAEIAAQFSNVSISIVQMLITLPQLISVPFSILAGKMTTSLTKKTITLLSISTIFFGGCIPIVLNSNILFLIAASCIIGAGIGGMITISSALICDYFDGEERSSLMGIQAAVINAGGVTFSILGGQLTYFSWRYTYYSFLMVLLAIILVALFLPKGRIEEKTVDESSGKLGMNVFYLALIGFIFSIFMNTYNTNISLYITELKLGGSVQASTAAAFCTLGGILAGIMLKKIMAVFYRHVVSFSLIITTLGLGLTFIGSNLIVISLGGFLIGFGFMVFTPSGSFFVSKYLPTQTVAMGIAIYFSFINIGQALSPIAVNGFGQVVGGGIKGKFMLSAAAVILIFIVTLIKTKFDFRNEKNKYQTNSH